MFVEFHCVHNGGIVSVDADEVNEIRRMGTSVENPEPKYENWTRLRMKGSPDVEIKELYEAVKKAIEDAR